MISTSDCLDGDLELKDGDCGRRCLGPLLCFERDLLDDEGVSLAGDGVLDFSVCLSCLWSSCCLLNYSWNLRVFFLL